MPGKAGIFLALLSLWASNLPASPQSVAAPAGTAVDCSNLFENQLERCQSFVTLGSTLMQPEDCCCSELTDTKRQCFCYNIHYPDQLSFSLDASRALTLPYACNLVPQYADLCGNDDWTRGGRSIMVIVPTPASASAPPSPPPPLSPIIALAPASASAPPPPPPQPSPTQAPAPASAPPPPTPPPSPIIAPAPGSASAPPPPPSPPSRTLAPAPASAPPPPPSPPHTKSKTTVVGACVAVGAVACASIVAVTIFCLRRRRTKRTGLNPDSVNVTKTTVVGACVAFGAGACASIVALTFLCLRRRRTKRTGLNPDSVNDCHGGAAHIDVLTAESLQYDFNTLKHATENFSEGSKIGKGGFGIVYKGVLADGQEIAVKRLTTNSEHSTEAFKNEVVLVASLQHRNLVKLMGFSLSGKEKLLVFEFAPNKSLEDILFDQGKKVQLDWKRRYKIINGIARGLLYLHEDSRHRIIHRDLKAANILLDADMIPKIADFGTARLVDIDESLRETRRLTGTFGYMAPEYFYQGQFSAKSDVYSFGVLTLEIISGKRVWSHDESGIAQDLLNEAWNCCIGGEELKFMDKTLTSSNYLRIEVKNCVRLSLLCVQPNLDKRPTMAAVLNTLNNIATTSLPEPQRPLCFNFLVAESSSSTAGKSTRFHSSQVPDPR